MSFVYAFIIGGVICALGTLIVEVSGIPNPAALIGFIVAGGVLTPLGVMDFLSAKGAGGVSLFACGFGNAAFSTGALLKAGNPGPIVMVILLLVVLIGAGAFVGTKN